MRFKKWIAIMILVACMVPGIAFADAAPGDIIVTLGEDLTDSEKQNLLKEMDVPADVETVTVTNDEEHQYLGEYISKAQIGSKAISSTKITVGEKDSGLNVETNNINWVTEEMYANALTTAGVTDADIYVTAPFEVSGTAALTGILKAYEVKADVKIPEEKKQVANEEMVKTVKLGDRVGAEKATELMTKIKQELAENPVETEEDLRALIQRVAEDVGIQLTDEELDGLVSLFNRMKELNIDWDQVKSNLENVRNNLGEFLNKEETQGFIRTILDFLISLIEALKNLFK
ncbi:DUF1002 domain-containing protein [Pseudalkalibacillus salsuginis]|uniref:DUF1002 domain-containing protein n=1 Tax=Pseudalkalibacillus salsuginis TaxID=2910972 RepID=UPI001F3B6EEB|nr:DUF1002 domain-containing protein [Pseudalkalibacillus salsuginis]MCF6408494.1 DUF1002 domain-containing protein [Pseudalkalibacillus salsuginis]